MSGNKFSVADLLAMRQMENETVDQFIARFKKARNKCLALLPKKTFADLAFNVLRFEIRKRMVGQPYLDLFQLSMIAIKHESLLSTHEEGTGTYLRYPISMKNKWTPLR